MALWNDVLPIPLSFQINQVFLFNYDAFSLSALFHILLLVKVRKVNYTFCLSSSNDEWRPEAIHS